MAGDVLSFGTLLYAAFIIVFVLVGESSYEETPENSRNFRSCTALSFYMYITGIVFIIYANLFVIHPSWLNRILLWLSQSDICQRAEKYIIVPATHEGRAVNSLFLRLGIILFGSGGAVLYSLLLFLIISGKIHDIHEQSASIEASLGLVFTFLQMYFMNANYKLLISSSKNICRLGFMHLLAVNVWTWYRFVTAKFHESSIKHAEKFMNKSGAEDTSMLASSIPIWVRSDAADEGNVTVRAGVEILGLLEYFGDFAIVLATCLIEYSVIGAAVMFIFWKQIDAEVTVPTKRRLRVDFSYTLPGIYAGIMLAILGISAAAIYAAMDNNPGRTIIFGAFDSLCFVLCILAVAAAAISMRSMTMFDSSHEDVDEILLYVAFMGELVWNSAELANFLTGQVDLAQGALIFVFTLLRLIHVFSQTWFVLAASRMRLTAESTNRAMCGRIPVTFLLTVNIILFFFGVYEFGIMNELSSTQGYLKLAAAPIIVFYSVSRRDLAEDFRSFESADNFAKH